jgi:hypothetical protein
MAAVPARRPEGVATVPLQYVGPTALTVFGGVTGTRYRFPNAGAVLRVDPRDLPSMGAIPYLRPVPAR